MMVTSNRPVQRAPVIIGEWEYYIEWGPGISLPYGE